MKKWQFVLVVLLNLFIAIGFFVENTGTGYTQLSSDLHNSIPVCFKLDDNSLYQKDLYLYDVRNVKYYTPFYIETIRFFAHCAGGDYLLGINIFATLLHICYGIFWFLLFHRIFARFTLALLFSVLVRGIIWLPGFEIWGISDLWTMMPRTMYAAFMPLPFLLLFNKTKKSFYAAAFLLGFIFNFHPISGIGGLLVFVLFVGFYCWLNKEKIPFKVIAIASLLALIGMWPFLNTYFSQTDSNAVYDVTVYKAAFFERIPHFFVEPVAFLRQWISFKILFFAIPLAVYYLYGRFIDKQHLKKATLLVLVSLFTIAVCSVSVYVEDAANSAFGLNIRMAFQIIRAQKLAILPGYVALGFLVKITLDKSPGFSKVFQFGVPVFILLLAFCKAPVFRKVPFFKDDIATSIFPDYRLFAASAQEKEIPLDRMIAYINKNTLPTDVFWGEYVARSACRRSVVLDMKGASMLIEGNPVELIRWYKEKKYLATLSPDDKIAFLKNKKGVTYILTQETIAGNVALLHVEGKHHLYKIQ